MNMWFFVSFYQYEFVIGNHLSFGCASMPNFSTIAFAVGNRSAAAGRIGMPNECVIFSIASMPSSFNVMQSHQYQHKYYTHLQCYYATIYHQLPSTIDASIIVMSENPMRSLPSTMRTTYLAET